MRLSERYLPQFFSHRMGRSSFDGESVFIEGDVIIDIKGPGREQSQLGYVGLSLLVDDRVIKRLAPEAIDAQTVQFALDEEIPLDRGERVRLVFVARDNLGLVYNQTVDVMSPRTDGGPEEAVEEAVAYGRTLIFDADGRVLQGPQDARIVR